MSRRNRRPAPPAKAPKQPPTQPFTVEEAVAPVIDLLRAAVVRYGYPVDAGGVAIAVKPLDPSQRTRFETIEREDGLILVGLYPLPDAPAPLPADAEKRVAELEARVEALLRETEIGRSRAKMREAQTTPEAAPEDEEFDEMVARGRGGAE